MVLCAEMSPNAAAINDTYVLYIGFAVLMLFFALSHMSFSSLKIKVWTLLVYHKVTGVQTIGGTITLPTSSDWLVYFWKNIAIAFPDEYTSRETLGRKSNASF